MEDPDSAALAAKFRRQAGGCAALGSPFYAEICEHLALDVERGGPVAWLLAPHATAPYEDAYPLRLLAGVHRLVLDGAAPTLARHFPSVGGDGDATASAAVLLALLEEPPDTVVDALRRPPQTNEVGRSVALASGLLTAAKRVDRPLRLRELGSSAGLNLRLDSWWYAHGDAGWGDPTSPLRFVDLWHGGAPPFDAALEIVDRRGCDRDPIDATTDDGSLRLLSYVWPEPPERFARVRDAVEVVRAAPVIVDRAEVVDWLPEQLADPIPGTGLVVMHSVVWQYLDATTRTTVLEQLTAAGGRATRDTPIAWLRLEPNPETYAPAELRLTLWDGSERDPADVLLATTGFHGGVISWR